jgi:O-acetyl-ADP-ribose deacetylase (regulator of RNase III)
MTALLPVGVPLSTQTARYDVLEMVGRGAMGEVYRGRHATLDREVAIKVLAPGRNPERFLREAQIAARVSSPHIVSVFDYHLLPDGSPCIVMEFIRGRSLGDEIGMLSTVPLDALRRYMRQAADGLKSVSAAGVVHRDVKPSNLLIDESGRLRIADFGLARMDPMASTFSGTLTEPGSLFGTPLYMSPEQADDPHGVDIRSDVYSYGATFYHAATGVPPFEATGLLAVLMKHKLETPAAPRARRPELPSRLNDIIERCLAKSPADRFQSFDQVDAALGDTVESPWEEGFDPVVQQVVKRYLADRERLLAGGGKVGELAHYRLPGNRVLRIIGGDIADAVADAIVSSDDESLSMGGGVSAALNMRSGGVLSHEVKKFGRVRHGGVVVTSAGALRARFVLHAVSIEYGRAEVLLPSRDILLQIIAGCFYHADTLNLRTLAFPLIGTGAAGFSPATCLDTMVWQLAKQLTGAHRVEEAAIVLHNAPLP